MSGTQRDYAFELTQLVTSNELALAMNPNGSVTAQQTVIGPLTMASQELVNVCNSNYVQVNITADDTKLTSAGTRLIVGAFMGNTVSMCESGNVIVANQEVNAQAIDMMSNAYNKPGSEMIHEISEAYQGGLISQFTGVSSPRSRVAGSVYLQAHNMAYPTLGSVLKAGFDISGNQLPTPAGAPINRYYVKPPNKNYVHIMTYP